MNHPELKERREAYDSAVYEFNRVKCAKLEKERLRSNSDYGKKGEQKRKDRERANRASAAASRAKIVFYSKELEKRIDQIELERNRQLGRAERATAQVEVLQSEVHTLKKALRGIWEMKDPKACAYLLKPDVLLLLMSRKEENGEDATTELKCENGEHRKDDEVNLSYNLCQPSSLCPSRQEDETNQQGSSLSSSAGPSCAECDTIKTWNHANTHAPTLVRTQQISNIHNLIHPNSIDPTAPEGSGLFSLTFR